MFVDEMSLQCNLIQPNPIYFIYRIYRHVSLISHDFTGATAAQWRLISWIDASKRGKTRLDHMWVQ